MLESLIYTLTELKCALSLSCIYLLFKYFFLLSKLSFHLEYPFWLFHKNKSMCEQRTRSKPENQGEVGNSCCGSDCLVTVTFPCVVSPVRKHSVTQGVLGVVGNGCSGKDLLNNNLMQWIRQMFEMRQTWV